MSINKDDVGQVISFYAYDLTDHITPKTGLSSFTAYYFLNAGSATAMTTPTVVEKDATNMKGWYTLAIDEATMVSADGRLSINVEATGMDPVAITIDIIIETQDEVTTALTSYDSPTRAEATTDKDEIITQVNANETKIDIIDTNVDAVLEDTDTTIPASITALNDITVADIIAGISDGTYDLQEMQRLMFSTLCCKVSGGGTDTIIYRTSDDSKDTLTITVDEDGNRTAVTRDPS